MLCTGDRQAQLFLALRQGTPRVPRPGLSRRPGAGQSAAKLGQRRRRGGAASRRHLGYALYRLDRIRGVAADLSLGIALGEAAQRSLRRLRLAPDVPKSQDCGPADLGLARFEAFEQRRGAAGLRACQRGVRIGKESLCRQGGNGGLVILLGRIRPLQHLEKRRDDVSAMDCDRVESGEHFLTDFRVAVIQAAEQGCQSGLNRLVQVRIVDSGWRSQQSGPAA